MRMPGLARLHSSMRQVGIDRAKFRITHNHLVFEAVFLADSTPWQLGLACIAHNFTLLFDVSRQYEVSSYIRDQAGFQKLLAALRTSSDSGHAFKMTTFLQEIDAHIPASVTRQDRPLPTDMARLRPDVEEADRTHLCGWDPHVSDGKHVTPKNLAKTRAWLGEAAYAWCTRHNVSTKWTDDPTLALRHTDRPLWQNYP